MLETPHVAVGAAIAAKIPNPFIAIPLAFASHFVLDAVPHWNPHIVTETKKYGMPTRKSFTIIVTDSILALAFGSFIAYQALPNTGHALTILAASLASVLPDLAESPYFFLKKKNMNLPKGFVDFHRSLQTHSDTLWGVVTQLSMIAAAILWIRN
jgi:hypothetical protein